MKVSALFLLRLVVSFAVVVPIVFFGVINPHQQALDQVTSQKETVAAVVTALNEGQKKLKELPGPKSITPQTRKAAHDYAQKLNAVLPVFNTAVPSRLPILTSLWAEEKVTKYNAAASDTKLVNALGQAKGALQGGEAFFNHYYAVMKALANLLEYNPTVDTKSTNGDVLAGAMEAAGGGLAATQKGLDDAPKYFDTTLDNVKKQIELVDSARNSYSQAISKSHLGGSEKSDFIAAVASAQASIIANRQAFWVTYQKALQDALAKAYTGLQAQSGALNSL